MNGIPQQPHEGLMQLFPIHATGTQRGIDAGVDGHSGRRSFAFQAVHAVADHSGYIDRLESRVGGVEQHDDGAQQGLDAFDRPGELLEGPCLRALGRFFEHSRLNEDRVQPIGDIVENGGENATQGWGLITLAGVFAEVPRQG
jgi:hypothetical protein